MDSREVQKVLCNVRTDLSYIVSVSGRPEDLVKLTTSLVQRIKKLIVGVPDDLSAYSTSVLTDFVKAARHVAKNPRAVDSKAIQELSSRRKLVEEVVDRLEKWHISDNEPVSSFGEADQIHSTMAQDLELNDKLLKLKDQLWSKLEPQKLAVQLAKPRDALLMAHKSILSSIDELISACDGKCPTRTQLINPTLASVDTVCTLLDIVDSLFVSKYPMRSQVHSFCSALIEEIMAYGTKVKSDNVTSLRVISTHASSLQSAADVMIQQCISRSHTLEAGRDMSIKRTGELIQSGSTVMKQQPTSQPKHESVKSSLKLIVCTSVAVDKSTKEQIPRGTEIIIYINSGATLNQVKKEISLYSGIPLEHIKLNLGHEELLEDVVIDTTSPLPFFLFNTCEPSDEEIREKRRGDQKLLRVTIEDLDWATVKGPVAMALYDYDTLGNENSITFDEGDIIEIKEKFADGWWEGSVGGVTGSFPASFVEEIESKEAGLRLIEAVRRGKSHIEESERLVGDINTTKLDSEQHVLQDGTVSQSAKGILRNIRRGISSPDVEASQLGSKVSSLFQKKKMKGSFYTSIDSEGQSDTVKESKSLPLKKTAPPRPPPFAATHPSQAAKLRNMQKLQESNTDADVDVCSNVSKSKESSSMENLLTSLQEFDELDPFISESKNDCGEMYEVVESSSLSDTTLSVLVSTPEDVNTSSSMCIMDEISTPAVPITESIDISDNNYDLNHHSNEQQVQDLKDSPPRLIVRPKKSPSKSRKQDKFMHPVPPPRTKRKSVKSDLVAARNLVVNQATNNAN